MADYSNLMAGYGAAHQANTEGQLNSQYRAQADYRMEIERQRRELKKRNGFWNKLGHAVTGGLTSGVQQGISGAVSTAFNPSQMLGGSKGAAASGGGDMGMGAANPYASSMANSDALSNGSAWAGGDGAAASALPNAAMMLA
jgi:hypothetical protein